MLRSLATSVLPALVLSSTAALPAQDPPAGDRMLSLEQTVKRGRAVSFRARPERFSIAPDGRGLVTRIEGEQVVVDPETWQPRAEGAGPEGDGPRRADRVDTRSGDVVFVPGAPEDESVPLTDTPAVREREAHLAPGGGRHVSFVRAGDLVVLDRETGEEWAVTDDGSPDLLDGVLDWVYQEEVYGRGNFQGHWWSPGGDRIAFLRIDETPVEEFTIVDHVAGDDRGVRVETMFYPKAGDPNPLCSLWVADVAARRTVEVDLGAYPLDRLVVRVGWTPDGDRVVVLVQDRIQTRCDLLVADPATGRTTRLVRLEMPKDEEGRATGWVEVPGLPTWLRDGSFLLKNEVATGYARIERRAADGTLMHVVAEGLDEGTGHRWPIRSVVEVDEDAAFGGRTGFLWCTGAGDRGRAIESHLFRAALDGSGMVQLTEGAGTHRVELGAGGAFFVDTWSNHASPGGVRVCRGSDGRVLKSVETELPEAAAEYAFAPKELHAIPTRDGLVLDATLIRPVGFDPSRSYPVWINTYSGPDAPSVRDAWRVSAWDQFLAQRGCLVLQVNVRTASARGHAWTIGCYRRFGVQELKDLEDAVAWLCANPWADAERVGIEGWSYGGFMAAYALTHSEAFALGIAGAGVHDWQLYDTIYTERYMSTPQLNPDGYRASSVLAAAENLHGHLVILHGTIDDNVHVQNAIRLVKELQLHDRSFELMLYPDARHGVRENEQRLHMQRVKWKAIRDVFGLGPAPKDDPGADASSARPRVSGRAPRRVGARRPASPDPRGGR